MGEARVVLFRATILGRVGIKKNGKSAFIRNGKAFITTSKRYKDFEKSATLQLLQEKNRTLTPLPLQIPLNLSCRFFLPNHQWEFDLTNAIQGPEDLLQSTGIIEDDRLVYSLNGSEKIFGSEDFRLEIEITPYIPHIPLPLGNL